MSEITIAGLGEKEANLELCAWLNERTGTDLKVGGKWASSEWIDDGEGSQKLVGVGEPFPMLYRKTAAYNEGAFTRNHNSIHYILDAMNDPEARKFSSILYNIRFDAGEGERHFLFATPAQKCEAVLLALGLGKPE